MDSINIDIGKIVNEVLSDGIDDGSCLFDRVVAKLETFSNKPANSIYEIKRRDNKMAKGYAWEKFCQWYLLNIDNYHQVWLWKEIPTNIKKELGLTMRNDNGIDLVAQRYESGTYTAIQCKYKKRIVTGRQTKVTWKTLSTFIALCARTGPWSQHIVMTNCSGISKWEIPRTKKDKTIAYDTFKKLSRTQCGFAKEQLLKDDANIENRIMTNDEIRQARLAHFENLMI